MAEQGPFGMLFMREAISSVALSHEDECDCDTCKAALGDYEAFGRVVFAVRAEMDRRGYG